MLGGMNKNRIDATIYERCLLTDALPFETPLLFSNWGSYNYFRNLKSGQVPKLFRELFENNKPTIPYNYKIMKDIDSRRGLTLIHPCSSNQVIELYKKYDTLIVKLCQKSSFSIRYPHAVARYFIYGKGNSNKSKYVEQLDENSAYASSYFTYLHFSHLHKFFQSDAFRELEKNYKNYKHLDISKCFPSIYTHSIEWALRGKLAAKNRLLEVRNDKTFGYVFDKLMQSINFNETNGIIIGPEFSRIFAEIIFQTIDFNVAQAMSREGFELNNQYFCTRYIDDFYIFYNDENVMEMFISCLESELEVYKLYLNSSKSEATKRPFITRISLQKIEVADYVNLLIERILTQTNQRKLNVEKEIDNVRSILFKAENESYALTNFFLKALTNRVNAVKSLDEELQFYSLRILVDISFYIVRLDMRVASIYRITKLINKFIKLAKGYTSYYKEDIYNKIYSEILACLDSARKRNLSLEAMNLLIAAAELGEKYLIPSSQIKEFILSCQKSSIKDELFSERLTYFEITTLLYYFRDYSCYDSCREVVLSDAYSIFDKMPINKYAEASYLLMDILSCPFVDFSKKMDLLNMVAKKVDVNLTNGEIRKHVNFAKSKSWFFNWNSQDDLTTLLRKKELILAY